jgi:hypothetical protein
MSSQHSSIVARFVVVAVAVAGFAWFAARGSLAFAEAKAAPAREAQAKAREAKAKIAEAEAAAAKARAIAAQAAEAAKVRVAAAAKADDPTPLDLSKHLRMKAENFAKSKGHPWPVVPTGSQTFAGIPVNIQGSTMTFGQSNANNGLKYPDQVEGIPCGQKFETLYIVHTAFYAGKAGEPAFEVVLHYPGDETQSDKILCGADTLDWYVKEGEEKLAPSAKRSALAWTGTGKSGMRDQTVRFCITAIDNKYPERVVETIDLVTAKNQTAGCVIAISVGNKGLLKPDAEKPADRPANSRTPNDERKP